MSEKLYFTKEELINITVSPQAQVLFVLKSLLDFYESESDSKEDSNFSCNRLKDTYGRLQSLLDRDDEIWKETDGTQLLLDIYESLPEENQNTITVALDFFLDTIQKDMKFQRGKKLQETQVLHICIYDTLSNIKVIFLI